MAESAVASVVRSFGTMVTEEAAFLRGVRADADHLRAELRRMQCFLVDADARHRAGGRDSERVTNWVVDVRAAAYDAEDVLEEADLLARRRRLRRGFAGAIARCADLAALHKFGVKIRRLRARIREISDGAVAYGITDLGETSIVTTCPREQEVAPYNLSWDAGDDSLVVGLHQERNKIIDELNDKKIPQISVVSIVGMAGSGKSTLARRVYKYPHVKEHFDTICWLVVSQKYRFLDLIKDVAKRIMNIPREKIRVERGKDGDGTSKDGEKKDQLKLETLEKMDVEEVKELLHDELAHKRFLVVLDDVWSNSYSEINRIIGVFPDVNNGSRVMLTTRDLKVAKHVNKRNIIHPMRLLDKRESWELLQKKAFQQCQNVSACDRSRLTPIGKKLAVKCKGLPLALVVLGGYLSRNLDYDIWLGLVDNLDWEARKNDEPVWGILARSYNDLPNHQLRSCFLYLASFPEDYVIRVKRLINQWIAEGFILGRHNRTMEDTAREYINELAQRYMLQVVDRSKADGSIKSVILHDILRDWGVEEARREGLFNIWCNTTMREVHSYAIPAYRVALHNFSCRDQIAASTPKLRTLWLFGSLSKALGLCSLTFLRVLDLYGLKDLKRLPSDIGKLMHLRYLGLQKSGHRLIDIPASISDLLNLQTLDARGSRTRSLPLYFWDVPTFRHIYLTDVYRWVAPEVGCLQSLQTLYFSSVCRLLEVKKKPSPRQRANAEGRNIDNSNENYRNWIAMIDALSEMKQLVFLHFENVYSVKGSRKMAMFPKRLISVLSNQSHLRMLELFGQCHTSMPISHFAMLPCTLRKLKLRGSKLPEDPMPVLGKLPNLVVLTLEDDAYQGEDITCNANEFPRLRYLTFNCVRHVKAWNVEFGAFPSLIQVNLVSSFDEMTVPPQGLLHVKSLREMQLLTFRKFSKNVSAQNVERLKEMSCNVRLCYTDDVF